jgi:TfoX/Sxy family transcriptional regulator of competence genes
MPYSEALARRVRDAAAGRRGLSEKKMFGGVGFLLHGNMCVGVWQNSLIVRVGPDAYEAALAEPHVVPFDITGRPMKGWAMVEPDGLASDEPLRAWIDRAIDFVNTLPKK